MTSKTCAFRRSSSFPRVSSGTGIGRLGTAASILGLALGIAACGGPDETKTPASKETPKEKPVSQQIDEEHQKFKEAIKEPAQKVDEAAHAVVDKGKEALGVDEKDSETAPPHASTNPQHPASEEAPSRIEEEHEKFKKAIKEPAEKVDKAARAVVKTGKELVGVEPTPAPGSSSERAPQKGEAPPKQ